MSVLYRFTALGAHGAEMGGMLFGTYTVDEALARAAEHVRTGLGRPELLVQDGVVLYEGAAFVAAVQQRGMHGAYSEN